MSEQKPPRNPNTLRKWREVRDVFNKLRKKYRADMVCEFLRVNYFMNAESIYNMLQCVDAEPVTDPSMIYDRAMRDDFNL